MLLWEVRKSYPARKSYLVRKVSNNGPPETSKSSHNQKSCYKGLREDFVVSGGPLFDTFLFKKWFSFAMHVAPWIFSMAVVVGWFLLRKVWMFLFCMLPSYYHCFTGFRTVFVFILRPSLPMWVLFFDYNGNINGKMAKKRFSAIKSDRNALQPSS